MAAARRMRETGSSTDGSATSSSASSSSSSSAAGAAVSSMLAVAAGLGLTGAASSLALCEKTPAASSTPSFDPEALERGAKALREINKSANAKQVN